MRDLRKKNNLPSTAHLVVVIEPGIPTRNQKLFSQDPLDSARASTHANAAVLGDEQMNAAVICWVLQHSKRSWNIFTPLDWLLQV